MSPNVARARWRLAVRLITAALVWSLGLVLAALLVPAYDGQTVTSSRGLSLTSATLVQVHGAKALILAAIPTVASIVVGVVVYRRRATGARWTEIAAWTTVAALGVVALLGILSIGAFMIPVVILLGLSVRLVPPPQATAPPRPTAQAPAT
ncbi:MAG TPA: hypothetical protein VGL51_18410 [Solirubrobacteraceae bacterium]